MPKIVQILKCPLLLYTRPFLPTFCKLEIVFNELHFADCFYKLHYHRLHFADCILLIPFEDCISKIAILKVTPCTCKLSFPYFHLQNPFQILNSAFCRLDFAYTYKYIVIKWSCVKSFVNYYRRYIICHMFTETRIFWYLVFKKESDLINFDILRLLMALFKKTFDTVHTATH